MSDDTTAKRILVLEDDPNLGYLLQENLELRGYEVTWRTDGEAGWAAFNGGEFDICLVDIMMPRKDGFTFAREVRRLDKQTPLIFLTAKSLKEDRIEGFRIGGDDFVTKPFSMEELLLRIEAVLRRSLGRPDDPAGAAAPDEFTVAGIRFDFPRRALSVGAKTYNLTPREAELLRLLLIHQGQVLDRAEALRRIWGDDSYYNSRSMDVFVSHLRKYLRDEPRVEILTVHGQGFRLLVNDE
jgi:DNA-binding response OmpR family regulator